MDEQTELQILFIIVTVSFFCWVFFGQMAI